MKQCARSIIARTFNQNKHMDHKYVHELVRKFKTTGSEVNKKIRLNKIADKLAELLPSNCKILWNFLLFGTQSHKDK